MLINAEQLRMAFKRKLRADKVFEVGGGIKMIHILEKDGAVIITIENPSSQEKELIKRAKKLTTTDDELADIFSKFKCNKKKPPSESPVPTNSFDLEGFVEICGIDDVPF